MRNQIENALQDLKVLLGQGKFIEAMEKYLADDVILQEGNDEPKVGKQVCLDAEKKLLETVTEFYKYDILHWAIEGDTSYYEAVMEFKTNDGTKHRFEQVSRTKWKDGLIVNERYYHV